MVSEPRLLRWVLFIVLLMGTSQVVGRDSHKSGKAYEDAQRQLRGIYECLIFVLVELLENSSSLTTETKVNGEKEQVEKS